MSGTLVNCSIVKKLLRLAQKLTQLVKFILSTDLVTAWHSLGRKKRVSTENVGVSDSQKNNATVTLCILIFLLYLMSTSHTAI